jgi:cardiolipin synthase A/B
MQSLKDTVDTIQLLHSGRDFFPALLAAIQGAQRSIRLETYNFANDATGNAVRDALLAAAARGVRIHITIDGFGSGEDGRAVVKQFLDAGIQAQIYRPKRWWQAGLSPKLLRRLHRKLSVFDDTTAFVGGINILDDLNHAPHIDSTLGPRFDFAVRLMGSMVAQVAYAMTQPHSKPQPLRALWEKPVALVQRDNLSNRNTIQKLYLKLLASAKHEVWLANAYFVPSYKLRRAIIAARKRGVEVNLLLQGRQEYFLQHHATQALYGQLLDAGVNIYEYTASFLHAKVAVVDATRATVGSSNIDPFSLMLAKEANVYINDVAFADELQTALQTACSNAAQRVNPQVPRPLLRRSLDWLAYGVLRLGLFVAVRQRY